MIVAPPRILDAAAADAYDVDTLIVELGGEPGDDAPESTLCQSMADVYAPASRFLITELFAEFLEARGITATEVLHKEEPLRSFLDWPRRAAVLDRLARHQARPGRLSPAQRLEELKRLEREVLDYTARYGRADPRRAAPPALDARTFAAAVAQTMSLTPGFGGRYALDSWLSAWLGEANGAEVRMLRLLSLDGDALGPDGLAMLDQMIGEMLANGLVIESLFGWVDGLRPTLEALAAVWRGEAILHPRAPAVVCRLSTFIGVRQGAGARRGLELTIHRALLGDAPLALDDRVVGDDGGDGDGVNGDDGDGGVPVPRTADAVMDELTAIAALSGKLARPGGGVIGGTRTLRLLDRRVALLLGEPRLEAVLTGKSHHARILDLLSFESAATGEHGRRLIVAAIQKHMEARDFSQRLSETARTPRARIKVLADLQRRIQRSTLPEPLRDRYLRMLDEIQSTFLRTNKVFLRIAKDRVPTVDDVMEFASLLAEGAFTEPKCAGLARDLVGHHVRGTAFLRAYLARYKDATEQRAERFALFFATLSAAGLPMRDMGALRILLADDEPAARGYVEMILRDLGIAEITVAENGRHALSCFEAASGAFDLIICDWKMPRLSGLEFLKIVRVQRPEMPFLMVTALATLIAVEEAMAHDVTAYIAKPFSPEQLEEKILVLVNRR